MDPILKSNEKLGMEYGKLCDRNFLTRQVKDVFMLFCTFRTTTTDWFDCIIYDTKRDLYLFLMQYRQEF